MEEDPGQSRGAACDVLREARKKPFSRWVITAVEILRVTELSRGRD